MYNEKFIDACLNGNATLFQLDDYIDYWHENDIDISLREFLGMTEYEYQEWGKSSDIIIRDILRCRREGIDFESYKMMSEPERLAARSYDQEKIELLKKQQGNKDE